MRVHQFQFFVHLNGDILLGDFMFPFVTVCISALADELSYDVVVQTRLFVNVKVLMELRVIAEV